ncbi:hypothetical protein CEXT_128511 [Caerostris extrusa]|uniref:Uncharacterized protein n=1 Tax=Caerostris extrusa TaxID=172846 RepID=A0AAV4S9N5_CAEEX|nr:hypothetical protein CEXT_128511 [Caerostris extrusa]
MGRERKEGVGVTGRGIFTFGGAISEVSIKVFVGRLSDGEFESLTGESDYPVLLKEAEENEMANLRNISISFSFSWSDGEFECLTEESDYPVLLKEGEENEIANFGNISIRLLGQDSEVPLCSKFALNKISKRKLLHISFELFFRRT